MRAISPTASSVKVSATPSLASRAAYCLRSALRGCVRICTKSASVRLRSSTRMGKRPCSSGMRSLGLAVWNAPEAMKSMWSVLTGPYLVVTVEPSTMGSRSRCTPARLTSAPPRAPPPPPSRATATLSISSMKTMPDSCARRTASRVTASMSTRRAASSLRSRSRASGMGTRRFFLRLLAPKRSCSCIPISSMPPGPNIWSVGAAASAFTSTSTSRASRSPARRRSRSLARVRAVASSTGAAAGSGAVVNGNVGVWGAAVGVGSSRSSRRSSARSAARSCTPASNSSRTSCTDTSIRSRIMASTSRPT